MLRRPRISHFAIIDALEVSFDSGSHRAHGRDRRRQVHPGRCPASGPRRPRPGRGGPQPAAKRPSSRPSSTPPGARQRLTALGLPGAGATPTGGPDERASDPSGWSTAPAAAASGSTAPSARWGSSSSWRASSATSPASTSTSACWTPRATSICSTATGRLMPLAPGLPADAYARYAAAAWPSERAAGHRRVRARPAGRLPGFPDQGDRGARSPAGRGGSARRGARRAGLGGEAPGARRAPPRSELYSGERSATEGLSGGGRRPWPRWQPSIPRSAAAIREALPRRPRRGGGGGARARTARPPAARGPRAARGHRRSLDGLEQLAASTAARLEAVLAQRGHAMQRGARPASPKAMRAARRMSEERGRRPEARRGPGAGTCSEPGGARRPDGSRPRSWPSWRKLGMGNAAASRSGSTPCAEPGPRGAEAAEFFFSANPGEELRPLARIASGGELSRVMLAFKRAGGRERPGRRLHLRRGRQRHRRPHRADRGPHAQGGVPRPAGDLHHPPAADRSLRRPPPRGAQGAAAAAAPSPRSSSSATSRAAHPEVARMLSGEDLTPIALKHAKELISDRAGVDRRRAHIFDASRSGLAKAGTAAGPTSP